MQSQSNNKALNELEQALEDFRRESEEYSEAVKELKRQLDKFEERINNGTAN